MGSGSQEQLAAGAKLARGGASPVRVMGFTVAAC